MKILTAKETEAKEFFQANMDNPEMCDELGKLNNFKIMVGFSELNQKAKILGIRLKNQSLSEWKEWLNDELTEPITVRNEEKYVLEAFLESIKLLEQ